MGPKICAPHWNGSVHKAERDYTHIQDPGHWCRQSDLAFPLLWIMRALWNFLTWSLSLAVTWTLMHLAVLASDIYWYFHRHKWSEIESRNPGKGQRTGAWITEPFLSLSQTQEGKGQPFSLLFLSQIAKLFQNDSFEVDMSSFTCLFELLEVTVWFSFPALYVVHHCVWCFLPEERNSFC